MSVGREERKEKGEKEEKGEGEGMKGGGLCPWDLQHRDPKGTGALRHAPGLLQQGARAPLAGKADHQQAAALRQGRNTLQRCDKHQPIPDRAR